MVTKRERAIDALVREFNTWSDEMIDDFIRPVLDIQSRPEDAQPYGWLLPKPSQTEPKQLITYEQLTKCLPHAQKADIELFFESLNKAMVEFEINTPVRIAAFLAQVAHESGSLRYKEEIASGSAYEGRRDLGNVYQGDGKKFKGRGIIQLTGRHNYKWASKALGLNLINDPYQATKPEISCRIAGLYWKSRGLNNYADQNSTDGFKEITRRINGGYNGWTDRVNHWKKAKAVLC